MSSTLPKLGSKLPNLELTTTSGEKTCIRSFIGSWLVIYFYPKDSTPGCTIEAQEFSKLKAKFSKLNCKIVGISKDSCKSHSSFIEKHALNIELISDTELQIQKKLGVWRKKKFMGREFMGTVRTTFLVDPNGRISRVWDNVRAKGHAKEVFDYLLDLTAV